ncbi:MAG: hypothetical protein IT308_02490 [Anaerolineaceae bacterium]|nr:hypothetical protein [Anaerolineaceae bacterium]
MKPPVYLAIIVALLGAVLFGGCASAPGAVAAPESTPTPNPCAPGQIGFEVKKINDQMRIFDDISFVAKLTDQKLLSQPLLEMLAVRREVINIPPPSCLETLHTSAVRYMDLVINDLAHFMGGISQEQVNSEVLMSEKLRSEYEQEAARLVGATYAPPPTGIPITPPVYTPQPAETQTSREPALVTNPGPASINIRFEPSMTSAIVGYMQPDESAVAIGRTADSEWIAIELVNSTIRYAWVYAGNVELNLPLEQLPTPDPTVTPAPSTTLTP